MILEILYLGSTGFVWYKTIKDHIEMDERLKKEGYRFTVKKFDKNDLPLLGLSALAMSIPLFNLVLPLSTMNKEQTYDEYKNRLLEAGSIEKIEPEEEKKVEPKKVVVKKPYEYKSVRYENLSNEKEDKSNKGHTYKKELNRNKHY